MRVASNKQTPDEMRAKFGALRVPADVADMLGVKLSSLTYLLYASQQRARNYTVFHIKKKSGGIRQIHAPASGIKHLQHRLNLVLQAVYVPKHVTHGFVCERNIVSNARPHVRQEWVLNIDLEDFFPTINFGRIRGLLIATPYRVPPSAATILAQLCCHNGCLPQGAPTSPVLSNMLCARMDTELRRLAQKHKCHYTRYADDLTFSTSLKKFPPELAKAVNGAVTVGRELVRVVSANGFAINLRKVKLRHCEQPQEVTGLRVNAKINVPRRRVRQARAMIHAWRKFGEDKAGQEFAQRYDALRHRGPAARPVAFRNVLRGKLEYIAMVRGRSDSTYGSLVKGARKLPGASNFFHSLPILDDALWVIYEGDDRIESAGTIGSAFSLDGHGLVTCWHVLRPDSYACHTDEPELRRTIQLIRASKDMDVAVLRVDANVSLAFTKGDPGRLRNGDEVTVLGFPGWQDHMPIRRTIGRVTGRKTRHGVERIAIDSQILAGNSGGPVLNGDGEVVGIAVTGSVDTKGEIENGFLPITVLDTLETLEPDLLITSLSVARHAPTAETSNAPSATTEADRASQSKRWPRQNLGPARVLLDILRRLGKRRH